MFFRFHLDMKKTETKQMGRRYSETNPTPIQSIIRPSYNEKKNKNKPVHLLKKLSHSKKTEYSNFFCQKLTSIFLPLLIILQVKTNGLKNYRWRLIIEDTFFVGHGAGTEHRRVVQTIKTFHLQDS